MKRMKCKIIDKRLSGPPKKGTPGSAGFDLRAMLNEDEILLSGEDVLVPTGIAIQISQGYAGLILPRSGLSKCGIILKNCVGLIDSDYQLEIKVNLYNRSLNPYKVIVGDRIAQLVIIPYIPADWDIVTEFDGGENSRKGGFGSTGR
jgi:dUTP pyrophosphatase